MVVDTRNGIFLTTFFFVVHYIVIRWREKMRNATPIQVVTVSEMAAIIAFVGSCIYLLVYFGTNTPVHEAHFSDDEEVEETRSRKFEPKDAVEDEEVIQAVVSGKTPSYLLETKLGDCKHAVLIRRLALERITGKSLDGLPVEGLDYGSILGQCCEMPVGYVQIPVGIAGPMLLDGKELFLPMATTEGCLVASTNRGCKAIYVSGGATSVLLKDGMTRAPVVRFGTAKRAAELKFFLEEPLNFKNLASVFNRNAASLVQLNMLKNLTGSALAGAVGGFNAHASNIVSAVFLATGQDPAQNIESSNCITMMEAVNGGEDLHVSVTMPSIEVGTIGGGTQLASQAACLNLVGVKGANKEWAGGNAQQLAKVVAAAVLAGEVSLMSAIAEGQLVKSHMKYNRCKDVSAKT